MSSRASKYREERKMETARQRQEAEAGGRGRRQKEEAEGGGRRQMQVRACRGKWRRQKAKAGSRARFFFRVSIWFSTSDEDIYGIGGM